MSIATCHTDGCGNNGIPIFVSLTETDPDTDEEVRVAYVVCGVCGQEIDDVRDDD